MSELKRIARDIEKKKNLEINLPKYMNMMLTSYHRYACIHLALSYYTCGAMLKEESEKVPESFVMLTKRLNDVIRDEILEECLKEPPEKGVEAIDAIRTEIMRRLRRLTDYADGFQIYEYVLNRVEYRFNRHEFQPDYTDGAFAERIINYIQKDRDSLAVNTRIHEIVGQLPMRMTKQRYFEMIKNSFALHLGDEREGLDHMIYMLRTCAALQEPEESGSGEDHLSAIYYDLKSTDYQNITEEEYKRQKQQLVEAADYMEHMSSLYVMLQEAVNDAYILLIAMPYALMETGETESSKQIIRYVLEGMEGRKENAFEDTEELRDAFEKLEGRQEHLYEQLSENDYLLDSMDELQDTMKSIMVDKLYAALKRIAKLASSSRFIELDREHHTEPVDEAYIKDAYTELVAEMEKVFQSSARLVNRARMAVTLESMPVFFKSIEGCRDYVLQSLENCSDKAEKLASVELIEELMMEQ